MSRRGAMWPTWLSFDPDFEKLGHGSQGLFQFLWMHPDLNTGGYITLAPRAWSRRACDLSIDMTQGQVDELLAANWVAIDDDTQELFIRPFIRLDSCHKPHMYVAAMRTVRTCRSPLLRAAGWEEIQAVYPPPLRRDPKKDPAIYDKLEGDRDAAFDDLRVFMEGNGEPFLNRSGTVREPGSGSGLVSGSESGVSRPPTKQCPRCGRNPVMDRGLCAACLGRELLP